jgi:hypothetical protein
MTIDDALFYGVYLSQILLVSLVNNPPVVDRPRAGPAGIARE